MSVPEFNIRLCGPISTSKEFAVAQRFAGKDGTVIKLSNNTQNFCHADPDLLRVFECRWISDYKAEHEFLMMGGQYQLRIESITHLENNMNYERWCDVLYYFDCMVTGSMMKGEPMVITINQTKMLSELIRYRLGYQPQIVVLMQT